SPYILLLGVPDLLAGTNVDLCAQNCFWKSSGAYTGEVSAAMLAGICKWVIVGHSERREMGETDDQVAKKAGAALAAGLHVIICVGENQEQLSGGKAAEAVAELAKAAAAMGCAV